ncbi:MAG: ferritin [Thiomonas sp. 14-64-326]|jgi:bacterioferritin|uniref:ferritin-like domain-containing protein n=1 Tax=Thiomonas sp. TaxID=2047785 RepID=UPI000BDBAFD9|nr:ferritin-like domain-containing protein [Thiomonas sp.]OZB77257.1 MAG: ferritin [Thiomonas sp. 14-64-326]
MSVDSRTLGWLTRALGHEMTAVQQYLAQSVLARLWGDAALAAELRREALEELDHASALMEQLILHGIAPCAGNLPPARLGRSPAELQGHDAQLETSAVHLYADALRHAQRVRDGESAALFARLLNEESQHLQRVQHTEGASHG